MKVKGIGEVSLVKSKRAKKLTLSVRPGRGPRVTLPKHASYSVAKSFVNNNKQWIRECLDKIRETENTGKLYDTDKIKITCKHDLRLVTHDKPEVITSVREGVIEIKYPGFNDVKSEKVQTAIKKGIVEALRKEAWEYLPERVEELAGKYGFKYSKVALRNNKTRWGSCSAYNNINLNIQLMNLPAHLVDYVILHELVHTVHKNHGPSFWSHLGNITSDAGGLAKELKKYRILYF